MKRNRRSPHTQAGRVVAPVSTVSLMASMAHAPPAAPVPLAWRADALALRAYVFGPGSGGIGGDGCNAAGAGA